MTPFGQLIDPSEAVERVVAALSPVEISDVPLAEAAGRVLAEDVFADRDSPALDVSAMDGYAFAADPPRGVAVRVAGESSAGVAPPPWEPSACVRIFTGAGVPEGATLVIPRERLEESADHVVVPEELVVERGQFVRERGENTQQGDRVLPAGSRLSPLAMSVLAANGVAQPRVRRHVRIAIFITGDEVRGVGDDVAPWQVRDGNGPALVGLLDGVRWLVVPTLQHVRDDRSALAEAVGRSADHADAVLVTGGVSLGDHDHTRGAIEDAGGRVLYHGLLMRPGKPNLCALRGRVPIFGLPGNPMSVVVGGRRLVVPALRRLAGLPAERPLLAEVVGDDRTLGLWWFRPATVGEDGRLRLTSNRSSGDVAGPATSDGVVEVPPDRPTGGACTFWPWTIT